MVVCRRTVYGRCHIWRCVAGTGVRVPGRPWRRPSILFSQPTALPGLYAQRAAVLPKRPGPTRHTLSRPRLPRRVPRPESHASNADVNASVCVLAVSPTNVINARRQCRPLAVGGRGIRWQARQRPGGGSGWQFWQIHTIHGALEHTSRPQRSPGTIMVMGIDRISGGTGTGVPGSDHHQSDSKRMWEGPPNVNGTYWHQ